MCGIANSKAGNEFTLIILLYSYNAQILLTT